jgi:hypothetical protein
MRCEDLTRELASPRGDLSPAEIAGHLASCPSCAEWSRRAARFDRIWEATRPPEPSTDAMDALWASASSALDEPVVAPSKLRFEAPARRRGWAMATFALAQAAAILLAALFLLRQEGGGGLQPDQVAVAPAPKEPVTLDLFVGFDQTAVVRIDKEGESRVEMLDQAHLFASSLIADVTPHDEYNEWEIMASR